MYGASGSRDKSVYAVNVGILVLGPEFAACRKKGVRVGYAISRARWRILA